MKWNCGFFRYLVILICVSCGGGDGDGGAGAAAVRGLNLTGVWRWIGVECYNSSFTTLTAAAIKAAGSYNSNISINGNAGISQSVNTSGCTSTWNYSFEATLTQGDSNGGYGQISVGATTANNSTGGSCTFTANLTAVSGSISPTTITSTYSHQQAIPAVTYEFLYDPPYLAIPSTIQVPSSPTDICLLIYEKL
jgi:hypothetical protein